MSETKRQTYRGIEIEVRTTGDYVDVSASAPDGDVFTCSSTHHLNQSCRKAQRAAGVAAIKLDIDAGTESCSDDDCDVCGEDLLVGKCGCPICAGAAQ